MTSKKEFKAQQAIGTIPKRAVLLYCPVCDDKTPQVHMTFIFTNQSPNPGRLVKQFGQWNCLVCNNAHSDKNER